MAMALHDLCPSLRALCPTLLSSVQTEHDRVGGAVLEHGDSLAQSHRASLLLHVVLRHRDHHRVRRRLAELLRVRVLPLAHISTPRLALSSLPRVADHRHLQTQTDPQIRLLLHARERRRLHHALDAAIAEPSGHQNPVRRVESVPRGLVLRRIRVLGAVLQIRGLHPVDHRLAPDRVRGVLHRLPLSAPQQQQPYLRDGDVRVAQMRVLPHDRDPDLRFHAVHAGCERLPLVEIGGAHGQLEELQNVARGVLLAENQRDVVDVAHVRHAQHVLYRNVAEQSDLALGVLPLSGVPRFYLFEGRRGAADQEVGGEAGGAELLHGGLRRLGLLLAAIEGTLKHYPTTPITGTRLTWQRTAF